VPQYLVTAVLRLCNLKVILKQLARLPTRRERAETAVGIIFATASGKIFADLAKDANTISGPHRLAVRIIR
jgi:hypothetical protein